eukprot:CAMPEP_0113951412 /NCGR_PEP_ID=MMETSP1339-20121228/86007_1 /TAXON_ID=94617 /ORGANISM="Fibrocapsa japonica" /LENGTH=219 /DNA_ID=CAMNT_0000959649 /DNA_START=100 /DNA_END=759 /DNA_ORIENTATION=+ /assembly_acc=CAM_ASM_000762
MIFFLQGIDYSLKLAKVMWYLHDLADAQNHILHRDLKPQNIGITEEREIKLYDFGLCKLIPKSTSEQDFYKMTGDVGTVRYMAPEVALKQAYNEKAEVFSFGMIVWQLLSHEKPFSHISRADEYITHVFEKGNLPQMSDSWPEPLKTLLKSCWNKDPALRPSFSSVVSSLSSFMECLEFVSKSVHPNNTYGQNIQVLEASQVELDGKWSNDGTFIERCI